MFVEFVVVHNLKMNSVIFFNRTFSVSLCSSVVISGIDAES
jgi:hypothetical protein